MTARFRRASITPFNEGGTATLDDKAVPFDFNPETLTLKTSAGQSRDRARQGRQQVQHAAATQATLSFEAVFDSTRPRDGAEGRPAGQEEELDVRLRTRPLALLVQAVENNQGGGGGGKGKKQPAPKRVQFRWGSIVFNGVISQYQEVFDFFSPGGVPLRSKVQITLTEQEFRYEVDSAERSRARAAAPPAPANAREAAQASGADSLLDLGPGGLSLGLTGEIGFSAGLSLQGELGLSFDLGLSAAAGFSLSADVAIDVFGSAALGTGGAAVGRAGLPPSGAGAAAPSPWAPEGPAPGSRAAALTGLVAAQRAAGVALAAPNTPQDAAPLPPRGSPPTLLPRAPAGATPAAQRSIPREAGWNGERRPRWEALGVPAFRTAAERHASHAAGAGCGCARCRGG